MFKNQVCSKQKGLVCVGKEIFLVHNGQGIIRRTCVYCNKIQSVELSDKQSVKFLMRKILPVITNTSKGIVTHKPILNSKISLWT